MTKSFGELEKQDTVTAAELLETLDHYATIGAGISHHVVTALIDRTPLTDEERGRLDLAALSGFTKQSALHQAAAAFDYRLVHSHLILGPRS